MTGSKGRAVSRQNAARFVRNARRRGKTVVFTNGVFDLLHVGHARVFERAKALGDVLIVGVNSDASVRRLKGSNRPIVPARDRAALLASLRAVDCVTIFSADTPAGLIRELRPDVLVKGGDWKRSQIAGAEYAGRVVRIPVVAGRSSSRLIERIRARYDSPKKRRAH